MLSSVLESGRAILVNVEIMRTFVRLRELLATHKDRARPNGSLREKLEELEKKYDEQFAVVFEAIRELMTPPPRTAAQAPDRVRSGGAQSCVPGKARVAAPAGIG